MLLLSGQECKRKCVQNDDGTWFCYKYQVQMPECNYRYLLQWKLQDHDSALWVVAFDNVAIQLLQMSAKEFYILQYDSQANASSQAVFNVILLNTFMFTLFVLSDTYNSKAMLRKKITKVAKTIGYGGSFILFQKSFKFPLKMILFNRL